MTELKKIVPVSSLTVEMPEIRLRFDAFCRWNLNGIWYRNIYIGQQDLGFYGTAVRYSGEDWIGSGHEDGGEGEQILELEVCCDRENIPLTGAENMTQMCRCFYLRRHSLLKHMELFYECRAAGNGLEETAEIRCFRDIQVEAVYHFMHPWDRRFQEYCALSREGAFTSGKMPDSEDRREYLAGAPWKAALYSDTLKLAVVSELIDYGGIAGDFWRFWNRGSQDRKLYYAAMANCRIRKGFQAEWRMKTVFTGMSPEQWKTFDCS